MVTALISKGVSLKGIGMFMLIHGLQQQEGYYCTVDSLEEITKDGRASIRTGIKELEEAGLLERKRLRVGGQLGPTQWSLITETLQH